MDHITGRDIQFRHNQFLLGKSLDGACPMGPWTVTADENPDPQNLVLHCWANGLLKQVGNTSQQRFSVAETISVISRGRTLESGDIIATGTPSSVVYARKLAEFLGSEDVVECEVDGIGRLRNVLGGLKQAVGSRSPLVGSYQYVARSRAATMILSASGL